MPRKSKLPSSSALLIRSQYSNLDEWPSVEKVARKVASIARENERVVDDARANATVDRARQRPRPLTCFACQGEGHYASECPNVQRNGGGQNEQRHHPLTDGACLTVQRMAQRMARARLVSCMVLQRSGKGSPTHATDADRRRSSQCSLGVQNVNS